MHGILEHRHGQPALVFLRRVQRDAIVGLWRIFPGDEHTSHVFVLLHLGRNLFAPSGQPADDSQWLDAARLDEIAAGEATVRLVILLIHDQAGLVGALIETDLAGHDGRNSSRNMAHVVAPQMTGRVRQAVRELRGLGIQ